ncbi:MAG TPA: Ig-like domain-containing protein [bacterium]|nr:Ig-like domain-containing protein [bacterium]
MKQKAAFVFAVMAGLWSWAFGQPSHTRELFRYDLTAAPAGGTQSWNSSGTFTSGGWKPNSTTGQLKLWLGDYMPFEGSLEVQVKGLSAATVTKDWIPFSVWSRGRGKFYQTDGTSYPSEGSYLFLKTDASKVSGSSLAFKLFAKSQYDPTQANHMTADVPGYAFNASTTYTLKFIWKPGTAWFQIWAGGSKVTEASTSWIMQGEAFLFVFLGRSNEYSSMTGVTYSNLVLKVPEKSIAFNDVSRSAAAVADSTLNAQSMTWADLNMDGKEDIYVNYYNLANRYYAAVADSAKFMESASAYSLSDNGPSFSTVTADFNGDGKLDAFVTNYGGSSRLLLNQGSTFSDQSAAWNIGSGTGSVNALAFDLENDGDVDLFVVNSGTASELYINQNNTGFTRTELSSLPFGSGARAVAGDVNKDGFVDVFYPRRNASAVLLINNKAGGFTDQASSYSLAILTDPNAPTLADLDNDGYLDLVLSVASNQGDGKPQVLYYRNTGGSSFTKSGTIYIDCYGAIVGDVDNDGLQDLYLIKRNKYSSEIADYGSRLYRNTSNPGSLSFTEYTGSGLEAIFQDGRGGAMADYNSDGLLDLYGVAKGTTGSNSRPYGRNFLFKNVSTSGNNWLLVRVLDKKKVPGYLGAQVDLFDQNGTSGTRIGYREISSIQGYQSQPSRILHFGMGSNSGGVLRVTLPGGQVYTRTVTANSIVEIDPTSGDAQSFILVKGNNQTGVVGTQLNDSLTVRVYAVGDTPARPLAGQTVTFSVTEGGGTVNGSSTVAVTTDLNGLARVAFKLGQTAGSSNNKVRITSLNKAGVQIVNLSAPGTPAAPIEIVASANAGAAARMDKIAGGDGQTGYMGEVLTSPVAVKVMDAFGNIISGYTVTFNVATGGGGFGATGSSPATAVTGPDGTAQMNWRLGATLGVQTLQVYGAFNAANPALFSATAAEPLRRLTYDSGDRQSARVGATPDNALTVRLHDYQGNAISGATVRFAVVEGGGKISGGTALDVLTSPDGLASIKPTLGTVAGDTNNVFRATATGAAGSITFKLSAVAGPAARLLETSGNNKTGKAGRLLSSPFVVRVTDTYANPVGGYAVDFAVTSGGGSLNGATSARVATDKSGYASIYYKLGTAAGTNSVTASGTGLTGSPVTFTAIAEAGSPALLYKVSGDNQKGTFGAPLAQPLVVALSDSFSNPIANQTVQFLVSRGGGLVNGLSLATIQTNAAGQAMVVLTLGISDFINQVTVSAQYLGREIPTYPSPLVFYATTSAGNPDSLVYISGNYQTGAVNQPLPEPFKVMVTDAHGVPVVNQTVVFQAITPGTHFGGAAMVTRKTNDAGLASAVATIGSNFGDAIYSFEARSEYNSTPLRNSPVQFFASGRRTTATKLVYVQGNGLSGTVGRFLADSLCIRTVNGADQPVANQPVNFEVISGSAMLNGESNSLAALSDINGIARMALKLGGTPGLIKVRATADDGQAALANSPIDFEITAAIGSPDGYRSQLTATSPVTANGSAAATVMITLKDDQGNPVQGKFVSLYTAGLDVQVTQPILATDGNGQTQGRITSTRAGLLKVWSMTDNQIVPRDTVRILFTPGAPASAVPFGSGQTALRGVALPQPIGLYLYDANNNPVPGVQVTFRVKSGGGAISQIQPVTTDAEGQAQVNWTLGSAIGEQYVAVVVPPLGSTEIDFWAIARPPDPNSMSIIRGNRQIGLINQALADSFVVAMSDANAAPAEGLQVIFSKTKGEGTFLSANPVTTDKRGYAAVLFKPGSITGECTVMAYHVSGLKQEFQFIVQDKPTVYLSKSKEAQSTGRPYEEMTIQGVVSDAYGQPLAGESLKWEIVSGGGTLVSAATLQSDAQGKASLTWKLGLKGNQSVKLSPVSKTGAALLFSSQVVNAAPELSVPTAPAVLAGTPLAFSISAYDADGDPITYGVRNLPAGAKFDSTASRLFSWTPTRSQAAASPYTVTFIARDGFQAADTARIQITVTTTNAAPVIYAFDPGDTTISSLYGTFLEFKVFASDADNDELTYTWMVNDQLAGFVSNLILLPDASFGENAVVLVRVSDGKATQELRWRVHLSSAVELSAFTAAVQQSMVLLSWQTSAENSNLGFNVLRSERSDGEYATLNTTLIPAVENGRYSYTDATAVAGKKYWYKLQDVERSGRITLHGPVAVELALPVRVDLAQNYPNPFNPATTIGFELPAAAEVDLVVYNLQGQQVRRLVQGQQNAGVHNVVWDARDDSGMPVPTGLYYYRLRAGDQVFTKKLLFAK